MVEWGKDGNGAPLLIQTSDITEAYNEIISWRTNVFLVPYGKLGREFIDQLTMHISQWNNKSDKLHIALKSVFVLAWTTKARSKVQSKRPQRMFKETFGLMERWKN